MNKLNQLKFARRDYQRAKQRIEYELNVRDIKNVYRSANRARQTLYDICRCNEFRYFVTWTFDSEKVERLNDVIVKRKFTQFQNYLRKMFPHMYYVAVPEYHKNGGLHFHLLVGGVTMADLKAVPARYVKDVKHHKKGDLVFKRGKQIFNVTRWKLGYSTLSVIENVEATKHYICKYITKQHCDDRFFGKKRYYVSNNIRRPVVDKWTEAIEHCLDGIDLNVYLVSYADIKKKFAVFTHDGNGIVNTELNSEEVKADIALLRGAVGKACAAAPRNSAPYLTSWTNDRKTRKKPDWKGIKKRFEHAWRKTLINFKPPSEDYNATKWEEQTILDELYASIALKPCMKMRDYTEELRDIGLID